MSVPRIAVLILAVLAAAAAAWLASTFVGSDAGRQQADVTPQVEMDDVLVAAREIPLGARVGAGDLRWQAWPRTAVTPAFTVKTRNPDAMTDLKGALARGGLLPGEPVTPGKLVTAATAGFMAARLSDGMRAVSIRISPETGAGGFILPGDRVDVILTRERGGDSGRGRDFLSDTIFTNVRVLAIDQAFGEAGKEGDKVAVGKTATLELTPQQAETLARAQAMGEIALSLRSLADTATGGPSDTGALGRSDTPVRPAAGGSVTVVRYGVRSIETPRSGQ